MSSVSRLALALAMIGVVASAPSLGAQENIAEFALQCSGSDPAFGPICREAGFALQAAQSGMGLLAAGGTQLPGSASTLGRRFGGMPRLSASLRGSVALLDIPDVRSSSAPAPGRSYVGLATQASLAAGLLDGFSLIPTVGGLLSLDLFATGGMLVLPDGGGYQDGSTQWGAGANVGLLRESFTLPGVTVSVARRWLGETQVGNGGAGDAVQINLDPTVTSVRGVVGKDLLAFGVVAGVGWDRYESNADVIVTRSGAAPRQSSVEGFSSTRALAFGGLSMSLLVVQFSAEGGWARGFDTDAARSGYDPGDSSLYLSVAGRLTL